MKKEFPNSFSVTKSPPKRGVVRPLKAGEVISPQSQKNIAKKAETCKLCGQSFTEKNPERKKEKIHWNC